jgi:hypothetical protein
MAIIDISVDSTLTLTQSHGDQNEINLACESNLFPMQGCVPYNSEYLDAYGTLSEANNYFDNRLRSVAWKRAKKEDKKSAMHEATLMIDQLNFIGIKTDPDQVRQFPRGPSPIRCVTVRDANTEIPTDIKHACFEIAIKLIQGYDPDREADILAVNQQAYSNVRTGYDRTFVPDYMRAGIPSFRAWTYLKPYLRNPEEIDLVRV